MGKVSFVTGGDKIVANLQKQIRLIEDRALAGCIVGAADIIRDTETVTPMVPVDQSNLRNSRFTTTSRGEVEEGTGASFKGDDAGAMKSQHSSVIQAYAASDVEARRPLVTFGYTAHYSSYVHEMIGAVMQRPGAGAKWLQAAIARNTKNILKTIQKYAKVPK